MGIRRRSLRIVVLALVVGLPLFSISGIASAKVKAKGCHKTHTCQKGGGAPAGGGTGGAPAPITIQIDPNPAVVMLSSVVAVVVQVEANPAFAGDAVDLSSSQFAGSCNTMAFESVSEQPGSTSTSVLLTLDNDGNATALMIGENCAPGQDLVEADLAVAPFYTALGTLTIAPPVITPAGVYGYPTTSGTVTGGEVETGDFGTPLEESAVVSVFYVETNPVYAEQTVEISSPELQARCGTGWTFGGFGAGADSSGVGSVLGVNSPATDTDVLDDDGNALFFFVGTSCAAGPSTVIADVLAGTHPTYTTTFTVLPPAPTI
jgi:hypothetical protein